jgi:hypothetical protein
MYPEILFHIDGQWCKGAGGRGQPEATFRLMAVQGSVLP